MIAPVLIIRLLPTIDSAVTEADVDIWPAVSTPDTAIDRVDMVSEAWMHPALSVRVGIVKWQFSAEVPLRPKSQAALPQIDEMPYWVRKRPLISRSPMVGNGDDDRHWRFGSGGGRGCIMPRYAA